MAIILLRSASSRSQSCKKRPATASRASSGHLVNQSMVQQLTMEGKLRIRSLSVVPMGLMAKIMCKCCLVFSMK